ncbi:MAG: helix-turn-helix transcriptional regulator, partial [Kurthia sp.]
LIHRLDQAALTDWTKEIQPFMKAQLATGLTIDRLAKSFRLSRTELIARYKQHFGETIGDTIEMMRREKASYLLVKTSESLVFISDQLGFKRQSSFSEWFRSRYQMTPLAFRKQFQQLKLNNENRFVEFF